MPSNSGSKRPPRPPSPPPPPPRRVSRRRKKVSESEEVSQETESEEVNLFRKKYQRRHGKDIYEVPDEVPPESSKEAKRRRNLVQDHQELSKAEKDELQSAAVELFLSNNPTRFLSLVCDFASSSVFHQNPQSQVKALWNFFAHQYPNALSLMLARLLNSRLPSNTVMYTVDLLHLTINRIHGQDRFIIDKRVLFHLKPLLLNVIQNHESIPNLLNLSEIAARIFEIERWGELLDYLLHALDTNFETRQEMALRVLSTLPESREECLGAYKFWWANHKSLNVRFGELFDSPNLNIQALTFDSSIKLVRLLHRWRFYSEIDVLLPKMISFLRAIHGDGQTRIVEPRIMDLVELASYYTDPFLTQLDVVLDCMFRIAVTADDNTFLTLQAIKIIKMVDDQAVDQVSEFLVKLSEEAKRSIFKNCVRLLVCIADVPAWYDVDMTSSEYMGISEKYSLGKFLLFRLCWDSHEDMLLSFGIELIPQYLNSEDWQTRHAGLVAFAETGSACSPAMIRDHAERVLEISLTDPHPRVLWAAIEVIRCLTTDSDQEHVRYLNNFVPRLVTIIRSASIYPRIQLHAATVVRRLINNCGDEEVKSFAECLEPELLKFVKQGGVFREEAIETLKLLAASFPVIFRRHYQETMDSLRDLVSQSLFGAQSMEYLSYILSGILSDESLFVLNDSQEVFLILTRIANNWNGTDSRAKIDVLKALSQLCKLQQLEADKFLNMIMPMLIQTLENTNPYTMALTTDQQSTTCPELRLLACDLLSKLAVRFEDEFEPWASSVARLLTRLFSSTDPDAKIVSVEVLPNILLPCHNWKEGRHRFLFNFSVRALVEALQEEIDKVNRTVMLKSLNACIVICGTVLDVDLIRTIADQIYHVLSQKSLANIETEEGEETSSVAIACDKRELEDEIIQGSNCLVTMISTLEYAFLTHVDRLLPAVEALWSRDNYYSDRVKAVAISIFNLILKDYPDKLQRYRDTYALVVMDACYSESPQLRREAARGIGLCATRCEVISNFDAPVAVDSLCYVIECGTESESVMTHDAAVSALGKICEFWRDTIDGSHVVQVWLNFLPLRNDFKEARYAHQLLCQMLERADQDLLGLNNENLGQATQILEEILSQSDDLATEETTCRIISLLSQFGALS